MNADPVGIIDPGFDKTPRLEHRLAGDRHAAPAELGDGRSGISDLKPEGHGRAGAG